MKSLARNQRAYKIVTGWSGNVTADSGNVTDRSGIVTEGVLEGLKGCA